MALKILSSEKAMASRRVAVAAWPKTPEEQARRLSPFCLPELSPSFLMDKSTPIFTIGSCFARNVEKQLLIEGYNALAGQFPAFCQEEGVAIKPDILNKFVAGSILNEVRWALDPSTPFDDGAIVKVKDGRYVDMQLAPGLMPSSMDQMLAIRRAVSRYMATIKDANLIIITLGLAEGWFDTQTGLYLNSPPHRGTLDLYPERFQMHVLDYNDIVSALDNVVALLERHGHPDFRILLTVSPVALGMTWTSTDALIANTYSKSVQRAAAGYIVNKYERVDYLPSFESVTLSNRAVVWRDDCAHVTDEAVRINVVRMIGAYTGRPVDNIKSQTQAAALHQASQTEEVAGLVAVRETAPDDVLVRYRLGAALYRAEQFERASEELRESRRLGGDHYGADYLLAKSLVRCGKWQDALDPLRAAVARMPDLEGPRTLLSKVQTRLNGQGERVKAGR